MRGGPLGEEFVHRRSVTCPLHNMVLPLDTGLTQGADTGSVATRPASIEGRRILRQRRAQRQGRVA